LASRGLSSPARRHFRSRWTGGAPMKLRAKVKPVIDKYTASVGETTVKELMAEIEKARK